MDESDLTSALGAGILSATYSVGVTTRLREGFNPLVEGAAALERLRRIVDLT